MPIYAFLIFLIFSLKTNGFNKEIKKNLSNLLTEISKDDYQPLKDDIAKALKKLKKRQDKKNIAKIKNAILIFENKNLKISKSRKKLLDNLKNYIFSLESSHQKFGAFSFLSYEIISYILLFCDPIAKKNIRHTCKTAQMIEVEPIGLNASLYLESPLSDKMIAMDKHLLLPSKFESFLVDSKTLAIIKRIRMKNRKILGYSTPNNHIIALIEDKNVSIRNIDKKNGELQSSHNKLLEHKYENFLYDNNFIYFLLKENYSNKFIFKKIDLLNVNESEYKHNEELRNSKFINILETNNHIYLHVNSKQFPEDQSNFIITLEKVKNDLLHISSNEYNAKDIMFKHFEQTLFLSYYSAKEISVFTLGEKSDILVPQNYKLKDLLVNNEKIFLIAKKTILSFDHLGLENLGPIDLKKEIVGKAQIFGKYLYIPHEQGFTLSNKNTTTFIKIDGQAILEPIMVNDYLLIAFKKFHEHQYAIFIFSLKKMMSVDYIDMENKCIAEMKVVNNNLIVWVKRGRHFIESYDISRFFD